MTLRHARCAVLAILCGAGTHSALHAATAPAEVVDGNATISFDTLCEKLASTRVVFVGETHDRYDHHVNQLEIIQRLFAADPRIAIGVEYFQQSFQQSVDNYIGGKIDEAQFLRATEYFSRWGYDYRMYAPIFRFARERHIPVQALNVPSALPSAVAKVGIAGLTAEQRSSLPHDMEPADDAYKARLRRAFEGHDSGRRSDFDHFVEAQLVWDEGMAENAAAYLNTHREQRMVILAGSGHLEFGSGIPKRLERRTKASFAIVINSGEEAEFPHAADYLLFSKPADLPPAGVLGASIETRDDAVRIRSLIAESAGAAAGLKKGDDVLAVDGHEIRNTSEFRALLWDKQPGDSVTVRVRRARFLEPAWTHDFQIRLSALPSHGSGTAESSGKPAVR